MDHGIWYNLAMILYHGSNLVVSIPELIEQNHTLDFGLGFYTTTNRDQAAQFAKKVVDRNGGLGLATINRYEFDDSLARQILDVIVFPEPNDAWLDFIVDNRGGVYSGPQYDVKIGPVANDNVYTTIQLYMSGVLSRDTAIRELKVRKLFNQVVFSSQRALAMLNFAGSEVIG